MENTIGFNSKFDLQFSVYSKDLSATEQILRDNNLTFASVKSVHMNKLYQITVYNSTIKLACALSKLMWQAKITNL